MDSLVNQNLQVSEPWRAFFSHQFRILADNKDTRNSELPILTSEHVERCNEETPLLPSPIQQLDSMINLAGDHFVQLGKGYLCDGATRSRIGALNSQQMNSIENLGVDSGLLERAAVSAQKNTRGQTLSKKCIELTLNGWERYETARRGTSNGNYAFVAMKYGDPVLEKIVSDTIKPAIKSNTGYEAIDLRDVARAGVIDNLLRQQLRESAFVLVDLTHDNAGAYWEAGYAEGLGKPVIYICEKKKFDEKKTHFDTNHCTTVIWHESELEQFANELVATIKRSLNLF